jgi:hypothetical protein
MKPLIVADLDALARRAVESGALENLSLDIHVTPKCHPDSGMKTTRAYEGDNMMLTCAACNLFVCNLKISKE